MRIRLAAIGTYPLERPLWRVKGGAPDNKMPTHARIAVDSGAAGKSRDDMKLGGEPSNWLGLGLLLTLIAVIALAIHWFNRPKPSVRAAASHSIAGVQRACPRNSQPWRCHDLEIDHLV